MDDTPEVIRQQMAETKSQLTEKLESLEHQVSETVQSTGNAVNATVASVQETVETVTGAVQDAVQSVTNALDLRRQFDRHPWLILGGSVALGYLAAELLTDSADESAGKTGAPRSFADNASHDGASMGSSWHQLKNAAVASLIGIVQDVASRAGPLVLDYLTGKQDSVPLSNSKIPGNPVVPPSGNGVRQRLDPV
jgi:cell division septum initiation protein DivIVA